MSPAASKRWLLAIPTITLAAVAFLATAGLASAHAVLDRSDPPDGAVLSKAPSQVSLWFTEEVLIEDTTVELVDGNGNRISVEGVRSDGSNEAGIVIELPDLAPNAYRLSWRTVASDDLHSTSGSIAFGVQHPADIAATTSGGSSPHPDEVAMRWLSFGAMAALFGGLAFFLVLVPAAETQSSALVAMARRRLLWLALAGGVLGLVAGMGLITIQAGEVGSGTGTWWHIVRGTAYGARWLVRQGLLIALAGVVLLLLRRRSTTAPENKDGHAFVRGPYPMLALLLPAGLALMVVQALNGHAGSDSGSAVRVGADALHLFSAALWVGGLLALLAVVLPLFRRGATEAALARSVFRRFGWPAALSLAVLVITGVYASGQQVASVDALLTTLYGRTLMLKVGLVMLAGLIGLLNASLFHAGVARMIGRVLRRPGGWSPLASGRLRITLLAESVGAVGVLLFAAVLTASPPARGPEFDPPSKEANTPPTVTANVADLVVTVTVTPNHPGQNFILLGVHDTRRPAPAPVDEVDVQLLPPGGTPVALIAEPLGDGRYQVADDSINATGDWQISATIHRQDLADAATTVPWTVTEAPPPSVSRAVLISNRPLRPILTVAAIVLAFLLAGTLAGVWLERRLPEHPFRPRPLATGQDPLRGRDTGS